MLVRNKVKLQGGSRLATSVQRGPSAAVATNQVTPPLNGNLNGDPGGKIFDILDAAHDATLPIGDETPRHGDEVRAGTTRVCKREWSFKRGVRVNDGRHSSRGNGAIFRGDRHHLAGWRRKRRCIKAAVHINRPDVAAVRGADRPGG